MSCMCSKNILEFGDLEIVFALQNYRLVKRGSDVCKHEIIGNWCRCTCFNLSRKCMCAHIFICHMKLVSVHLFSFVTGHATSELMVVLFIF